MTHPSEDGRRVLIAGCGYVGSALAAMLAEDGEVVWGLKRNPSGLPRDVRPLSGDVGDPATLEGLPRPDAIVYAVAPPERSAEAYQAAYVEGLSNLLDAAGSIGAPFDGRLVLVSSTGVYGESDGGWVDEDTPPEPADETGRILLEGERMARVFGGTGVVLRLGGIYGPGRDRTIRRVCSGEAGCPEAGRYGNRIHRDDAAGAARHLLLLDRPAPLYVGVDGDPAELRAVYRWIAEQTGVPDPCAGHQHPASGPPRRRGTNKRCSNERLVRSGYAFRYPTFREGYAGLLPGA